MKNIHSFISGSRGSWKENIDSLIKFLEVKEAVAAAVQHSLVT